MVVPVSFVSGVPMPVVHIVDMIVVGHGDVTAAASVLVSVTRVRPVAGSRALVDVPVVRAVDVSVVHVVDVVAVRHGDVSAALLVPVLMGFVGAVLGGGRHDVLPMRIDGRPPVRRPLPHYRITLG